MQHRRPSEPQNTVPKIAYSLEELSRATSLSVMTLRRRIREGELRATHLGRRVVVTAADIDSYLSGKSD